MRRRLVRVFGASVVLAAMIVGACSSDDGQAGATDPGFDASAFDAHIPPFDATPLPTDAAADVDAQPSDAAAPGSGPFAYDVGNYGIRSLAEDSEKRVLATAFDGFQHHPAVGRFVGTALDPAFHGGILEQETPTLVTQETAVAVDGHVYVGLATAPAGTFGVLRLDDTGHPDSTFGTAGVASINADSVADASASSTLFIEGVTIQSDGKVLVYGEPQDSGEAPREMFVARFTTGGQVDTGFGTNGLWTGYWSAGTSSTLTNVVIAKDNSILIAGHAAPPFPSNLGVALGRLSFDGKRDSSFGGNLEAPLGYDFSPYAMRLNDDGTILVAASIAGPNDLNDTTPFNFAPVLLRWTAAGLADTSFGNDAGAAGILRVATGDPEPRLTFEAARFDHQGRVVFAGALNALTLPHRTPYAIRVLPSGAVDSTFGTTGHILPTGAIAPPKDGVWYSVLIRSDDSVVLGGQIGDPADVAVKPTLFFQP